MDKLPPVDRYLELNLRECGKEKCIPDKKIHFTPKNYHLFHYVMAGKGFFILNNRKYELKKGDIFYIPPLSEPDYYPSNKEPWTYAWVGFNGLYSEDYVLQTGLSNQNPIYHEKINLPLKDYFNALIERHNEINYLDLKCLGYFHLLIATMIESNEEINEILSKKQRYVNNAKEFIHNNYQFEVSVEDIANSIGITPNYLANIFQEVCNISPKQYLTEIRMKQANLLITNKKEFKIKDIALMVGYKNQLHFSSEFKKYNKKSPLDYRKEQNL